MNYINMRRTFNAKVKDMYAAWTNPELLTQWMGPGDVKCIKFENDLNIGGKYEIHMQTDDGVVIAYGEYKEIEPNKRLAFTWSWKHEAMKTLVALDFVETESGTEMILNHTNFPSEDLMHRHTQGWHGCIDKLNALLMQ